MDSQDSRFTIINLSELGLCKKEANILHQEFRETPESKPYIGWGAKEEMDKTKEFYNKLQKELDYYYFWGIKVDLNVDSQEDIDKLIDKSFENTHAKHLNQKNNE